MWFRKAWFSHDVARPFSPCGKRRIEPKLPQTRALVSEVVFLSEGVVHESSHPLPSRRRAF